MKTIEQLEFEEDYAICVEMYSNGGDYHKAARTVAEEAAENRRLFPTKRPEMQK